MSDIDHVQIKAEIDGIMNGVKKIMKKIDALVPDDTSDQEQLGDQSETCASSNNSPAEER